MKKLLLLIALSLGLFTNVNIDSQADSGEYISRPFRPQMQVTLATGSPAASWQLKRAVHTINVAAQQEFLVLSENASADIKVHLVKQIENNHGILGLCNISVVGWDVNVLIVTGLNDQQRVAVMTHEIIHALGIMHSNNPNSLMFFVTNPRPNSQILTDDDLLNIRSAVEDFQTQ